MYGRRLNGFNPVWRDFLLSSFDNRRRSSVVTFGFNPVWRDFLLSRKTIGIGRKRSQTLVSIPSGGIFCCLGNRGLPPGSRGGGGPSKVSIPSGGIFCCLGPCEACRKLQKQQVSIPSGGIFCCLGCLIWCKPRGSCNIVSIPSGGIFCCLDFHSILKYVYRDNSFNPVWRDFLLSRGVN